jgi:hypothetical protein
MLRPAEELDRRQRATTERLSRFRGEMCDADFAQLVKDVVRVRDKSDGRTPSITDGLRGSRLSVPAR